LNSRLDSPTETDLNEFRDADAFRIGLTVRSAWQLHDYGTTIRRDALAREGFGDSGYDPLCGDSVGSLIIEKAQELLRGELAK
tara:strand:- start:1277 stop:1525 length:249 start_codon:yes stop_codon:yes gene_type:complete